MCEKASVRGHCHRHASEAIDHNHCEACHNQYSIAEAGDPRIVSLARVLHIKGD